MRLFLRVTYPNTLFYQIVLVALQLQLKAIRIGLDFLIHSVDPPKIWETISIFRRDIVELRRSDFIASDILALLRLGDG